MIMLELDGDMSTGTIRFLAPVANVDASILKVSLKNGFSFFGLNQQQARDLLAVAESSLPWSAGVKFFMDYPFLNFDEKVVYFVENRISVASTKWDEDWFSANFNELAQFENQSVRGYLLPTMRKLKLFSRGNVDIPFWYYLENKDNHPKRYMGHSVGGPPPSRDILHLNDGEIGSLLHFLDKTDMPLSLAYLELAFENYELSYQVGSNALAFLTLMICLETLFNPGGSEVRYRLSRNVAVLLGETAKESEDLFKRVRSHYDTRSEIVHTGKTNSLRQNDVAELRELCRIAIKRLVECNLEKDAALEALSKRSFGSPLMPG